MSNFSRTYSPYLHEINQAIYSQINASLGNPKSLLKDILYYHFDLPKGLQSGKRIRPLLVLLCNELGGGRKEQAIPAAVALEFLHNYSLIHDDIEDEGITRHGRLSVWKKYGIQQAINSGDALYGIAFHSMASLDSKYEKSILSKVHQLFSTTAIQLTIGQSLDISYSSKKSLTVRAYWEMVKGKTAELFALACELGGLLAGMESRFCKLLRQFGLQIGFAFQTKDDILGIWGDPKQIGKSVESDLLSHKNTLPVIYALAKNQLFQKVWDSGITQQNIAKSIQMLNDVHALEYSEKVVSQNSEKALWNLEQVTGNEPAKVKLREFVVELMNRSG